MKTDWTDRVVMITGASSGIGAALSGSLSRRGARVALLARRADRLEELATRLPGETLVVPCDVTVETDRNASVDHIVESWGRIDVLVNNAGVGHYAPFADTDLDALRDLMEIDFVSAFAMAKRVLPHMIAAGRGLIVNVASTGGLIAHAPNVSAYLAAKHAVVGMSRGLRRELDGSGVRVQVVCPHLTDTGFFGVGVGAEEMELLANRLRDHMDSAESVAEGIVAGIEDGAFLVFPTPAARAAYERFREPELGGSQ